MAMGTDLDNPADEVVDARGKFIFPGAIDSHTHISMPFMGTSAQDDYETGTKAAACGGVTCVVDFDLQQKGETLLEAIERKKSWAEGKVCGITRCIRPSWIPGRKSLFFTSTWSAIASDVEGATWAWVEPMWGVPRKRTRRPSSKKPWRRGCASSTTPDCVIGGAVKKRWKTHELDIQIRFSAIDEKSYADWALDYGQERSIITLLGRKLTATQLSGRHPHAVHHTPDG